MKIDYSKIDKKNQQFLDDMLALCEKHKWHLPAPMFVFNTLAFGFHIAYSCQRDELEINKVLEKAREHAKKMQKEKP